MKGSQRLPGTSIEAKTTLQPQYGRLDPCAKLAQTVVNVLAAAHTLHTHAALLCKTDVLDLFGLRPFKVPFRGKAPIQGNLEGIAAIDLIMTVEHLFHQGGVSGITFDDKTICNQIGRPHTEANLMSVKNVPAIFLDDIGVGLEEGTDLLLSRNALTVKDSTGRLIDHLFHQG